MSSFEIGPDTPQRVAIVIEKNKAGTWSVGSYLVLADGRRQRHGMGAFNDYSEAAAALQKAWESLSS